MIYDPHKLCIMFVTTFGIITLGQKLYSDYMIIYRVMFCKLSVTPFGPQTYALQLLTPQTEPTALLGISLRFL